MIKINLLPSGKKKAVVIPPVLIYGLAGAVLLVLIMAGITFYINSMLSGVEAEITTKEKKLKTLKATLVEVRNYEADNEEYRKKTKIIEQLKKNQVIPLRLLDEVSEMLPKGVWLTKLSDKNSIINIEGYAFSNSDLVGYVQNLKGSKYLKNVMLVESRQDNIENYSVYNFKITFKMTL